jgi:hypothetical protein
MSQHTKEVRRSFYSRALRRARARVVRPAPRVSANRHPPTAVSSSSLSLFSTHPQKSQGLPTPPHRATEALRPSARPGCGGAERGDTGAVGRGGRWRVEIEKNEEGRKYRTMPHRRYTSAIPHRRYVCIADVLSPMCYRRCHIGDTGLSTSALAALNGHRRYEKCTSKKVSTMRPLALARRQARSPSGCGGVPPSLS